MFILINRFHQDLLRRLVYMYCKGEGSTTRNMDLFVVDSTQRHAKHASPLTWCVASAEGQVKGCVGASPQLLQGMSVLCLMQLR
jgi:hypothetical protein